MYNVIIMCGGVYNDFKQHKALSKIKGEVLVERTIRLLEENGVKDWYISATDPAFDKYKRILKHENTFKDIDGKITGYWVDAYYPVDTPTIYLHGDVYYTDESIKKILNLNPTKNTFIGNEYALNDLHIKVGEPFGWIIPNPKEFFNAIEKVKHLQDEGKVERGIAISWELYEVLNGYNVNDFQIDKDTYLVLDNVFDIDAPWQIEHYKGVE